MSHPAYAPASGAASSSGIPNAVRRRIVTILLIAAAIDIAYWVIWSVDRSLLASDTTTSYFDFQNAFPLADAWLGLSAIAGAWTLSARRPMALFWLLAGGGAGLYLFAMDVLYDVQHGIWLKGGSGIAELLVNVITLAFSLIVLAFGWRRREDLLNGA